MSRYKLKDSIVMYMSAGHYHTEDANTLEELGFEEKELKELTDEQVVEMVYESLYVS